MSAHVSLESALAHAVEELERAKIPYMLIGGLALSAWALPRATLDIDFTLWVAAEDLDRVCLRLCASYLARVAHPAEFVRKTRVLPVTTSGGVRLDFIFAAFPFEKEMIERAVPRRLGGVDVRVATLEDLVLLKLPSSRDQDQEDVRLILKTYAPNLNWSYLLFIADALAEALDQPRIAAFLRERRAAIRETGNSPL